MRILTLSAQDESAGLHFIAKSKKADPSTKAQMSTIFGLNYLSRNPPYGFIKLRYNYLVKLSAGLHFIAKSKI